MVNQQLINPKSIVVIGGSNDTSKPGGKVLKNLIDGNFKGGLYVSNPKEDEVQGLKCYKNINDLPEVDLAIIAIAAKYTPETVELLTKQKNTRAFIILSAGFSEENEEGKRLEKQVVELINNVNGSLIGPNCIGFLNNNYNGIFTTPIPRLDPKGVDFISGSGATAVFIMESGIPKGLTFSSLYSVGNSAQMGVEEVLKYMDETYNPETSSNVKLLYVENIKKPQMFLKHASSLIRKGCKIAAIKSGASEAGSRAASSHTGALASPDLAVTALFKKAGIVRCQSREELVTVAGIFLQKELKGKRIAIVTHAGGPAVLLTDALSFGGMEIPEIKGEKAKQLLEKLYAGSSVANPIDFLATGTAEQLGFIIDAVENDFDQIDAMAVIFGSPGLFNVYDVYDLLNEKMKTCKKPIFPILPSTINANSEIQDFINKGRINFSDEVVFGNALCKIFNTPKPAPAEFQVPSHIDVKAIREVIDSVGDGYLKPQDIYKLLDAAKIDRSKVEVVDKKEAALAYAEKYGFPLVMKVVGPLHKSDVGGVVLNVKDAETVSKEFDRLMAIKDTYAVEIYQMLFGKEIFIGAQREEGFGHQVLCGLGGIFVELLKDVQSSIAPFDKNEALSMMSKLKGYGVIKGARGQEPVNEELYAQTIANVASLVTVAPEIYEMDLNPLLGSKDRVAAVDARINIKKS